MKLGVFSMPCHPPHRRHSETYKEDLEAIVLSDKLGFDEFWLGEHYTSTWENIPDPTLTLAQASVLTKNIILATGVSCIPDHNPAQLASRIAQLDQMLEGRFMWGVGVGAFPGDAVLYEVPQTGPHRTVTHENIDAILKLWTSDNEGWSYKSPSGYDKFNFTVPDLDQHLGIGFHMRPYQKPYPPIAVAGLSKTSGTLRWAGQRGWIPMSIHFVAPVDLRGHWKAYEEGCAEGGFTPKRSDWRLARDIYVADTDEQAQKEAVAGSMAYAYEQYFFPLMQSGNAVDLWKDGADMPDSVAMSIKHQLATRWIVGSPETVTAKMRKLYEDVGGFGGVLMLHYDWEGDNGPQWKHSMDLLATKVMPELKDLTGAEAVAAAAAR
jgi:alkanesulfonate monooxygenase SsuD/methylene tetrahydromethanopterin reductase-like flavin-dependent oxidoreductase (luciferase family)